MDIERLINRHKNSVYRLMIRTCQGNHEDAEDSLAEALYIAIKASSQLQNPDHFQAWLTKIASRICIRKRIRDRILHQTSIDELHGYGVELPSQDHDPFAATEMQEIKQCVAGAISLLPESYREVYLRREINGERTESVAKALNLSVAATKTRLHRARQIVRTALDRGLGCPDPLDP